MKKVNVFGMPIDVVSDDDVIHLAGKEVLHLCIRVADSVPGDAWPALAARRIIRKCHLCKHDIWYDPLSIPKGLVPVSVCFQCLGTPV